MKKFLIFPLVITIFIILSGCQKDHFKELKEIYSNSQVDDFSTVKEYLSSLSSNEQQDFIELSDLIASFDELKEDYLSIDASILEKENSLFEKEIDLNYYENATPINMHYFYQLADDNRTYVGWAEEFSNYVVIDPKSIDYLKAVLRIFDGSSIPQGTQFYGFFRTIGNAEMIVGNYIEKWKIIEAEVVFTSIESKNEYISKLKNEVKNLSNDVNADKELKSSLIKDIDDVKYAIEMFFTGTKISINQEKETANDSTLSTETNIEVNGNPDSTNQEINKMSIGDIRFPAFKYKIKDASAFTSTKFEKLSVITYNTNLRLSESIQFNLREMNYSDGYCFEFQYYPVEEELYLNLSQYYARAILESELSNFYFNNLNEYKKNNDIEFVSVEFGQIFTNDLVYIIPVIERVILRDENNNTTELVRNLKFHYLYNSMEAELNFCEQVEESSLIIDDLDYTKSIEFIPFSVSSVSYPFDIVLDNPFNLNKAGMTYYENGNFELAASLFRVATNYDGSSNDNDSIALAYFNLACTLSLLAEERVNYDNVDEILMYLERSFELKPDRVERSKVDSDLSYIRKTREYKMLMLKYN